MIITAKIHNEWNTLDEVGLLLHKIGMVQLIVISMTKVTKITPSLFLTLKRPPFDSESREFFLQGAPCNYRVAL